ncbi:MAG: DNA/RNA non-specific endonuclease [Mycobacterium sp.]
MTIEIPGWLQWVSYLAGSEWPEGDEDAMQRLKAAWQASANEFRDLIPETNRVRAETTQAVIGQSANAIDAEFAKLFDGDYSLEKLAQALEAIGEMAGAHGTEIQYTKMLVLSTLAIAAVQISFAIAAAPETLGGSLAEVPVVEAVTITTIRQLAASLLKRILETAAEAFTKTAVKRLVKSVGIQLAIAGGQDFGIQALQNALGTRHGYDVNRLIDTAVASTVGAATGHMIAPGLSRLIARGNSPFSRVASSVVRGYSTGVGANVAGTAALMTYRDGVTFDPTMIFGGAATAGLMHQSVDSHVNRTTGGGPSEPVVHASVSDRAPSESAPRQNGAAPENGASPHSNSDTTAARHSGESTEPAAPPRTGSDSPPSDSVKPGQPSLSQDGAPRSVAAPNQAGATTSPPSSTSAHPAGPSSPATHAPQQSPAAATNSAGSSHANAAGSSHANAPAAGLKDAPTPAAKASSADISRAPEATPHAKSEATSVHENGADHTVPPPHAETDAPLGSHDGPEPAESGSQDRTEQVNLDTAHQVPDGPAAGHADGGDTRYPGPNECARQTIDGFQDRHPGTTVEQVSDHGGEGTPRSQYEQALGTRLHDATPADILAATREGRSVIVVDTYRAEGLTQGHPGSHTYAVEPNPRDPHRPLVYDGPDRVPHPWPPHGLDQVARTQMAEFHPDGKPVHPISHTERATTHADDGVRIADSHDSGAPHDRTHADSTHDVAPFDYPSDHISNQLDLPGYHPGTLDDLQTRTVYLNGEQRMNAMHDEMASRGVDPETRARAMVDMRNELRSWARELMVDRQGAADLNRDSPNRSWDQVVAKYSSEGYQGRELYEHIVEKSTASRQSVNEGLGIDPRNPGDLPEIQAQDNLGARASDGDRGPPKLKRYMVDDGPGDPIDTHDVRAGVTERHYAWDSLLGEPGIPRENVLGHPDTTDVHRTRIERDFAPGTHREFPHSVVREVEVTVGRNTAVFTVLDGHPARVDFLHRQTFDPVPERPSSETSAQASVGAGHAGDDAGHMSAFRFTLDQEFSNLFPQELNFNRGAYKTMENEWGALIDRGGEVYARIELIPPSERPDKVAFEYVVNKAGTDEVVYFNRGTFDNTGGQKFKRLSIAQIIKKLR